MKWSAAVASVVWVALASCTRAPDQATPPPPTPAVAPSPVAPPSDASAGWSVVEPNGGETYALGQTAHLRWNGRCGGIEGGCTLSLTDASGATHKIADVGTAAQSYDWTIQSYRNGDYVLPGTYTFVVHEYGYCQSGCDGPTVTGANPFTITGDRSSLGTLDGTLRWACSPSQPKCPNGEPLEGFTMGFYGKGENRGIFTSGADGTFHLALPPGAYDVKALNDIGSHGYTIGERSFEGQPSSFVIKPGVETKLDLAAQALGSGAP